MGSLSNNSKDITFKTEESQDESSYYYNLRKDNSLKSKSCKNQSTNNQSETTENSRIIDLNEKTIPFKFEWKEGGNEVKITGSFLNNWKEQMYMKKNLSTGFFEIILNISKSVHQFKFIVDKKWACSPNYRTIKENNNINNTIDLTNFDPNIKNDNESLNFKESKKKKKTNKKR